MKKYSLVILVLLSVAGAVVAQRRGRGGGGWGGGSGGERYYPEYDTCNTAREVPSHSTGTPNWTNEPGFEKDVFTFVRVRRGRVPYWSGPRRAGEWWTDFPDSDLN